MMIQIGGTSYIQTRKGTVTGSKTKKRGKYISRQIHSGDKNGELCYMKSTTYIRFYINAGGFLYVQIS